MGGRADALPWAGTVTSAESSTRIRPLPAMIDSRTVTGWSSALLTLMRRLVVSLMTVFWRVVMATEPRIASACAV